MSAFVPDAPERVDAAARSRTAPDSGMGAGAAAEATVAPDHRVSQRFPRTRARLRRFIRREHPPASLRQMLVKAVLTSITVPVCFVGAFALCWVLGVPMTMHPHEGPVPATPSGEAGDAVLRLIEQHGCWMNSAPPDMEGKDPGHAVVTWPGRTLPTYGGERAVAAGLEHVVEDRHPDLRVHAFCR